MIPLNTAGLVVIKNRKLLLAFSKNKKAWYLPGGKIDGDESIIDGLIREIKEELNIFLNREESCFYIHIAAPAFGEHPDTIMEQDCFFYPLAEIPEAAAEIEALKYFDCNSYRQETPVPGVILLMLYLQQDNLID
jgi:8-oxo-dGTP pyrophosphatase MutT (NUDIX family)